ncbi:hypothetical protein BG005_001379 [Podila minutissima]|nr:hypothetical protein BG005_001379 [Podila minutissima]
MKVTAMAEFAEEEESVVDMSFVKVKEYADPISKKRGAKEVATELVSRVGKGLKGKGNTPKKMRQQEDVDSDMDMEMDLGMEEEEEVLKRRFWKGKGILERGGSGDGGVGSSKSRGQGIMGKVVSNVLANLSRVGSGSKELSGDDDVIFLDAQQQQQPGQQAEVTQEPKKRKPGRPPKEKSAAKDS